MVRKAIALFSTLLIMTMVMALLSISLDNLTKINTKMRFDRDLIQENLTFVQMHTILKEQIIARLKSIKNDNEKYNETVLALMKNPLTIQNPVNNNIVSLKLISTQNGVPQPLSGKLDFVEKIGYLGSLEAKDEYKKEFIEKLLTELNVEDTELFGKVFGANIGSTDDKMRADAQKRGLDTSRMYFSGENSIDSTYDIRNFDTNYIPQSEITDWESFYRVLDVYVKASGNVEVYKSDWQKYFKLTKGGSDVNYLDKKILEVISLVDEGFDSKMVKTISSRSVIYNSNEELGLVPIAVDDNPKGDKGGNSQTILDMLNIGFKSTQFLCEINIKSISNEIKYIFSINLEENEAIKVKLIR